MHFREANNSIAWGTDQRECVPFAVSNGVILISTDKVNMDSDSQVTMNSKQSVSLALCLVLAALSSITARGLICFFKRDLLTQYVLCPLDHIHNSAHVEAQFNQKC